MYRYIIPSFIEYKILTMPLNHYITHYNNNQKSTPIVVYSSENNLILPKIKCKRICFNYMIGIEKRLILVQQVHILFYDLAKSQSLISELKVKHRFFDIYAFIRYIVTIYYPHKYIFIVESANVY